MTASVQNLSIIGCGQVGTSILLAMAKQEKTLPTSIFDQNPETETLVRAKFAAEGYDASHLTFASSIANAVSKADLIILATPMSVFEEATREIADHAKSDAIITDTGSAKVVSMAKILKGLDERWDLKYVAAHPGNGSQGAGPETASAGNILGRHSTMFLMANEGEAFNPPDYFPEGVVKNFYQDIGVITAFITPEKHDKFFGQCSHFQHALVFSLMNMAQDNPAVLDNFKYAGTALRNMSRVAISQLKEGQPSALVQMWQPIFDQNEGPISNAYQHFRNHFDEFVGLVKNGQFDTLKEKLDIAKNFRDSFDDPERRETIVGELADLREVPKFDAKVKGSLTGLFTDKSTPALATNLLLPLALSYAQLMSAHDIDPEFIAAKANPSFRDGTHPSTYSTGYVTELMRAQSKDMVGMASIFDQNISPLMTAIQAHDAEFIQQAILKAQIVRNNMPAMRKGDAVREEYERKSEPA